MYQKFVGFAFFVSTCYSFLEVQAAEPSATVDANVVDPSKATRDNDSDPTLWYDAQLLTIEGQGWSDEDLTSDYDRLPSKAENTVRDAVWSLSRHSSGIVVKFISDAPSLRARWTLTSGNLDMPHMPATGVSGVDLYAKDDHGKWRWLACGKPTGVTSNVELVKLLPEGTREYQLYLPLYNGVTKLEIGVPEGSKISRLESRTESQQKPIVFYGTSITHGACASRPGMPHPAIIGRKLDRPTINLGFSGNGRMETEVAKLLAELDAAVFVIDCLPNIGAEEVTARTKPCVEILRKSHPKTPIVLVEDRTYGDAWLLAHKRLRNETSRAALRKVFEELKAGGDENLYYLEGDKLLLDDDEATVDSSHPTDLGFMRQADAFLEVLTPLVKSDSEN